MTSASTPGPLNPGNVVSAALRMYRDRFKAYIGLSLLSVLWIALPVFVISAITAFIAFAAAPSAAGWALWALLVIVAIAYCWAKCAMYSGIMARISFKQLVNEPETVREAKKAVQPKMWSFLWLGLLLMLIFIVAYIVIGLGVVIVGGVFGALLGTLLSAVIGDTGAILATILTFIIVGLGLIFGLLWALSRVFIAEVPLAIEPQLGASDSIGRSWQLTAKSVLRIQFVVLAAYLITLPVLLVSLIPQLFQLTLEPGSPAYALVALLSLVVSLFLNIMVLPFWQAVKGVLYYDLRSRREGLDLSM